MAIVCAKCEHELPQATIISYVACATAVPIFYLTKDVILTYLQTTTRSNNPEEFNLLKENILLGVAKQIQISCSHCNQFNDWITIPN